MPPRHAGLPSVSDVWLADQWEAWQAEADQFAARVSARLERMPAMTAHEVANMVADDYLESHRLLTKARLLAHSMLGRRP